MTFALAASYGAVGGTAAFIVFVVLLYVFTTE